MRTLSFVLALLIIPIAAVSQTVRTSDTVLDVLQLGALLEIMQEEAIQAGADLETDLLGGRGGTGWTRTIERINDADVIETQLRDEFHAALSDDQVEPILTFFESESGKRIVTLELSARRALLDPDVEAMNLEALAGELQSPRMPLLDRFVEANGLIDRNVAGALQANVAFLEGLQAIDGGGAAVPAARDDILAQVASQEPEIRADTTEWVYGFLYLAYRPLTDETLEAYIAFSESEAGRALNDALFDAFDLVFVETSRQTGEALARVMASEDI
ncbi:MAG: DUF2059 domain-containing protein [Pseudomonadota bacterium]